MSKNEALNCFGANPSYNIWASIDRPILNHSESVQANALFYYYVDLIEAIKLWPASWTLQTTTLARKLTMHTRMQAKLRR